MDTVELVFLAFGGFITLCGALYTFYRIVSAPQQQQINILKDAVETLAQDTQRSEAHIMSAVSKIDDKIDKLEVETATREEVERKIEVLKTDLQGSIQRVETKVENGFELLHTTLNTLLLKGLNENRQR